jgi:hypothetical protein
MNSVIMRFSPVSYCLISLRPKYSPQHLFSINLSLCPSSNVRDVVLHLYKTDKIIGLYVYCLRF